MVVIPEGITVEIEGNKVRVKGPVGALEKSFDSKTLSVKKEGNEVKVESIKKKETRRVHSIKKSFEAHLRNMFGGAGKAFQKTLTVVYSHFPVSVEAKGSEVLIKNFLGEKIPRHADIVGETKVSVSGQTISVSGQSKEHVGQTANNIVRATKIVARDIRVFQDGIYYA